MDGSLGTTSEVALGSLYTYVCMRTHSLLSEQTPPTHTHTDRTLLRDHDNGHRVMSRSTVTEVDEKPLWFHCDFTVNLKLVLKLF